MGPVVVLANSFASTVTIGYVASIDAAGAGHIYCSVFRIGRRGRHGDDVEEGIWGEKGDELGHEIATDSSVIYIHKLMVLSVGVPPEPHPVATRCRHPLAVLLGVKCMGIYYLCALKFALFWLHIELN